MSYNISASTEASAPAVLSFCLLVKSSDNLIRLFDEIVLLAIFTVHLQLKGKERCLSKKKEGKGPEKRVIFFVWPYIAELTSYNGRRVWF